LEREREKKERKNNVGVEKNRNQDLLFSFVSKRWSEMKRYDRAPLYRVVVVVQGANFINSFTSSFYTFRSQKCKKQLDLTVFVALLGSVWVKGAQ